MIGDKVQPVAPSILQDQKKDRCRNLLYLLHCYDDPGLEIVADGEETLDGKKCRILTTTLEGVSTRLWVAADGEVLKQTYQGNHPVTRAPENIEVLFSDLRAEGPVHLHYTQISRIEGEPVMSMQVESFELDPKADPAWFQKPAQ